MRVSTWWLVCCLQAANGILIPMETLKQPHPAWRKTVRAPAEAHTTVLFVLKTNPEKQAVLERTFWEVSDPRHANYGRYLTLPDIAEMAAPEPAHLRLVLEFLSGSGVPDTAVNVVQARDVVYVKCSSALLERMLNTTLYLYSNQVNKTVIRTDSYYLPEYVSEVVALVGNLVTFPPARVKTTTASAERNASAAAQWPDQCGGKCTGKITPAVIRRQYNITAPPTVAGNSLGIAEFVGQYYDQADLNEFTDSCSEARIVIADAGGRNSPSSCTSNPDNCIESLLDLEIIGPLAHGIPLVDYYLQAYSVLEWATAVNNMTQPALVWSVSYGDDESMHTASEMAAANLQFQKLALRGLSVFFARCACVHVRACACACVCVFG